MLINNRYELLEKIGAGGMGEVYQAHDRLTSDIIALKRVLVAPDQLVFNSQTIDTNLWLALAQEFKVLASLRHPHIISVLDYGFDEGRIPYFAMEYLPNAKTILNAEQPSDTDERVQLIIQLLQGLAYLHQRGLIHRDLKPHNIMMQNNQVKIIDFGLAVKPEHVQNTSGTLTYLAPEQFTGMNASVASDLYAVGLIAYELFLGRYPFDTTQSINLLIHDILETPIDCTELPLSIQPIVEKLLQKKPTSRYVSASDTIQALSDAIGLNLPPETAAIRESFLQASSFVGREVEIDTLNTTLEAVLVGQSAFYLIGGESGVGKSRLVDELRTQALIKGFQVWRGQAVEGGGLPFQLWRDIVRRLLLNAVVNDFQASVLKDIVPDIAQLLNRPVVDAPNLTGSAYQQRLVLALVELLQQTELPLLLVLEDLHWTSESLLPLQQILKITEKFKHLMVVGTYRNDERPDLAASLAAMTELNLPRLNENAIAQLTQAMLGQEIAQQNEVVEFLAKETEGNTFFMVEVVRALAEEAGSMRKIGIATLPPHVLTGNMHQILQRRLAKIPPESQGLLQSAAIAGRQIDKALLQQIHPQSDIQDWLLQGEWVAVLDVQEDVWRFTHDKLREAVLQNLNDTEKPNLHREVAQALESIYPNNEDYNEALLEHWHQADDTNNELVYVERVVSHHIRVTSDFAKVHMIVDRTLAVLPDEDARRIALLNWKSETYERQGRLDEGLPLAQTAHQLAHQSNNQAQIAESLNNIGLVYHAQGKYEDAQTHFAQSLAIRQEIGDPHGMALSLNNLGRVAWALGNSAECEQYHLQCLTLRQEIGDQRGVSVSYNNLGVVAKSQENYTQAQHYYEQCLLIAQKIGFQQGIAAALTNLGNLARQKKNFEQADAYLKQALNLAKSIGDKIAIAYSYLNLGTMYVDHQKYTAINHLRNALAVAYSIQAMPLVLESLLGFAKFYVWTEKPAFATQLAGMVQHHPAHNNYTQKDLDDLLPQLAELVSPTEFEAALSTGSKLDFSTIMQELLNEFEEASDAN